MDWDTITGIQVRVKCADMATMNKVRAWARRNNATVDVSRYARDAYEGHVAIRSPWNEGREVAERKAEALRVILHSSRP